MEQNSTGWGVIAMMMVAVCFCAVMSPTVIAQKKPVLFELQTMDGETYRLQDELEKKVIILNFWATWCKPCLREMPQINSLYEKYREHNLQVLAISIDTAASRSQIRPTINRYKFSFPVLLDTDNNVIRYYSPNRTVPYLVVIGADGSIIREFSGHRPGDEKLIESIIQDELKKLNTENTHQYEEQGE